MAIGTEGVQAQVVCGLWRRCWWPLSDSHASNPACPGVGTVPCILKRQPDSRNKPDDDP